MKKLFIWLGVLIAVAIILLLVIKAAGLCPEYINRMPTIIGPGYDQPAPDLGERLYNLGLCHGTEIVY